MNADKNVGCVGYLQHCFFIYFRGKGAMKKLQKSTYLLKIVKRWNTKDFRKFNAFSLLSGQALITKKQNLFELQEFVLYDVLEKSVTSMKCFTHNSRRKSYIVKCSLGWNLNIVFLLTCLSNTMSHCFHNPFKIYQWNLAYVLLCRIAPESTVKMCYSLFYVI